MPTATAIGSARRILIYGVCGAGKTTLAAELSSLTLIPWHSVDDLAWLPGWQATTEEYQRGVIEAICAADEWILDTAYGQWIDLALERVELIVALDYPRWISFLRLFKRTASRIADKKPVCNGNYETLRNTLSRDSILLWHFRSFNRKRRRIRQWANAPSGPTVIVLRSPRTAAEWLASTQDKRGDVVFGNIAEQKLKSGPKF